MHTRPPAPAPEDADQDATRAEPRGQGLDRKPGGEFEEHQVGLRRFDIEAGDGGETGGETGGVGVVLGEPRDVVIERVKTAGGGDAALTEGAAEALLPAPGGIDESGVAGEHGADRRAQSFGEIEPDAIEGRRHGGRRNTARDHRVEEPRPVHMGFQAAVMGEIGDHRERGLRPDAAAAEIRRLLDGNQGLRRGIAVPARGQRRLQGRGVEHPARAGKAEHPRPGQRPRRAALAGRDMGHRMGENLIAGAAMGENGDLVAHRARRQEHRRLLAEEVCHAGAEGVDRRILAALLVADLGGHHRRPHRRARARLGVREQVHPDRRQSGVGQGGREGHQVFAAVTRGEAGVCRSGGP